MHTYSNKRITWIPTISFAIVFIVLNIPRLFETKSNIILLLVSVLVYLIGLYVAVKISEPMLAKHWKNFKEHKWTKFLWILLGYLIVLAIISLVRKFIMPYFTTNISIGSEESRQLPSLGITLLASFIPLLAPLYEELVFRHGLFRQLAYNKDIISKISLAIVSSIAFGLIHYFNFGNVLATIPYMFAGFFLCFVYNHFNNIFYPIFIHFLLNGINILLGIIGTIVIAMQS